MLQETQAQCDESSVERPSQLIKTFLLFVAKTIKAPQGWLCWLPPEDLWPFLESTNRLGLGKVSVVGSLFSVLIQDEPHARIKTRKYVQVG